MLLIIQEAGTWQGMDLIKTSVNNICDSMQCNAGTDD
jgi:hypothetical protein